MDFGTAIKTCFNKYADFEGQATRSEYWFFFLFIYLVLPAIYFVSMWIFITTTLPDVVVKFLFAAPAIWIFATLIPHIAVTVRRLHDIGKSGWWLLIVLTGIGVIVLIIWFCTEGGKKYRPSTTRRDDDEPTARRSRERSESKFSFGSSSKSGKVDVIDELEELKELYEDGTLSEAQFKKAKKKLLK